MFGVLTIIFLLVPIYFIGVAFVGRVFYTGLQLIYNVVLVSGIQQSDSVIHIHMSILFSFNNFTATQCQIEH